MVSEENQQHDRDSNKEKMGSNMGKKTQTNEKL